MESRLDLFKVLSDENRLRIIVLLIDRELCISHIYMGLNLKQSNTSRHLKVLREGELVTLRINGQSRYYSIHPDFELCYKPIFDYLTQLKEEAPFKEDGQNLFKIKSCSCKEFCECKL